MAPGVSLTGQEALGKRAFLGDGAAEARLWQAGVSAQRAQAMPETVGGIL